MGVNPAATAFYTTLMDGDFDVAILDVNLPDISGFELARVISSSRPMGVIMLTARTGRDDRIKGYEEGADLYLTKPVDGEELALAIANLARRVRSAALSAKTASSAKATADGKDHAVSYGSERPWLLDLQRHRLTSPEGVPILLSGREAMLVEQLARAAGSIVPRAVLDAFFGTGSADPESRRLDAALRRLRMKARAAGADLPLHVVHAVGVRFVGALKLA
ncbi:response regulator transcription factor [Aminobacter aminovorans]|uniref:response regulator transcription factor n=1 Tax=Aminobacter aminovorans TaxID=83263 RepID=UPI002860D8CD|nr:response regulator transcription factor [Aminobacter aminovorans]MDR7219888.1 two-component system torCAD operon response regulator TorR [Aminobacter aminovorans]